MTDSSNSAQAGLSKEVEYEVETVCSRDCPDTCFLVSKVREGKIVSVRGNGENPVTQKFICPKGIADPKRVYSEFRVLYPFVRVGGKSQRSFERVPWLEALRVVAGKLIDTINEFGRESVLLLDYSGNIGILSSMFPERLWNALGATQTDGALCTSSGRAALGLHYGLSYGIQPEELLSTRAITFWGFNARVSSAHQFSLALRAREESGATLAVVDPRRSETAEAADLWLQPRPGSDVALAYGLSRYLIERDYIDDDFIGKSTYGYERFREEAMRWTPRAVEDLTGIGWGKVEELGEIYHSNRPGAFMIGIGFSKSQYGAEAVRAVSLIPALLGYHRGFYFTNSKGRLIDFSYLTGERLSEKRSNYVSQVDLARRLKAGDFRFIFVYGMNPAMSLPDQRMVREGFSRDDVFLVVHDTHWTETTDYADVVLPAPTFYEKEDFVVSDSHSYTRISCRVVDPLGESRDEPWLMQQLSEKLGLKEGWLYEDPWRALELSLASAFENGTFSDLQDEKVLKLRARRRDEYQTSTGKIEFCSIAANLSNIKKLPSQYSFEISNNSFTFLNSAVPNYLHTQFTDVHGAIPPLVWINPSDALNLNIAEGEKIKISNDFGSLMVRAVITDSVSKGVVWSPKLLTDLVGNPENSILPPIFQVVGGGPTFNSTKVKIVKCV